MDHEEILRLAEQAEAQLTAAWIGALAGIRSATALDELADLLQSGQVERAMSVFAPNMAQLTETWNDVFVDAGRRTSAEIQAELANIGRGDVVVRFDMVNDSAVRAMQESNLRLIQGFTDSQTAATRQALTRAISEGLNPRQAAQRFVDSIGLTPRQEAAVVNYRRLLESNSAEALTRELRDRRFDRTIQRALDRGEPLTDKQIERMVERYRERSLAHRARTIARTESLRAVHEGQHNAMRQAVEKGTISEDQITREWNTAADERVRTFESTQGRTSHATMHRQQQVGLETPFVSGAGNLLRYPTDPNAPAYDVIQCRCSVAERLSLTGAPGVVSVEVIG